MYHACLHFFSSVPFKVTQYSFFTMENLRYRCVFLDNYYLLKNKRHLTYVKQHLKSFNFGTKVTQLLLLWQQWRFHMPDILVLNIDFYTLNTNSLVVTRTNLRFFVFYDQISTFFIKISAILFRKLHVIYSYCTSTSPSLLAGGLHAVWRSLLSFFWEKYTEIK
jgi:hypothetical protein